MQKSKWILQTLVLSVGLNTIFLCIFFYFLIRDNPLRFSYRPKEEILHEEPPLTSTLLGRLHAFTFDQLVELLSDDRKVEQGYYIRDFALGVLYSIYDFDVERGLSRGRLPTRKWEFDEQSLYVFPGLTDIDFENLRTFALNEYWPFTIKGLFRRIRDCGIEKCDPKLLSYFCHCPPFILLETLFARTQLPIQKKNILHLALEAGWENLSSYLNQQVINVNFSSEIRQKFLISAIEKGSQTAAYLLLITDPIFAEKELDDAQIVMVLDLLSVKTHEAYQFAQYAVSSPRSDRVKMKALEKLVEYTGHTAEEMSGNFYEKPGLKELRPVFRQRPPSASDPSIHIIQPGESLWSIACKYKIPIEKLMEMNQLKSEVIQSGKTLKIPCQ